MAAPSQEAHRRRVLEYQTRLEEQRRAPIPGQSDPQLKIPLVGEVKRNNDGTPQCVVLTADGQRTRRSAQPELGKL